MILFDKTGTLTRGRPQVIDVVTGTDNITADELLRLYFSRSFARAMDQHVHTEFPLLRDLLHRAPPERASTPTATPSSHTSPVENEVR